jgi:ATP-dependent DNA ligase
MSLPLTPPVLPQLARSRATLPDDDGWAFEPKWDGFRAIAFVDGDEIHLQSRNGKPLTRYFPEVRLAPGRYVLDGELVIHGEGGRQEFDLLGQRIHPAASRINRLAEETPARFVAFDLLARDDDVLLELPYGERRAALEAFLAETQGPEHPVDLTPMVQTAAEAEQWLQDAEGVIAKQVAEPYRPGERTGMVKIKRVRTIDAVVRGWRPGKAEGTLGALILALYDEDGNLREVGHSSGFTAKEKRELPGVLAEFETGERGSGEPSRWSNGRDLAWVELRPELVVEVTFDHVSDGRIRHGAKVQRWREDKPATACTIDQLDS